MRLPRCTIIPLALRPGFPRLFPVHKAAKYHSADQQTTRPEFSDFGQKRAFPRRPPGFRSDPPPRLSTSPSPIQLAERIIRRADREHPADAVLRAELKAVREIPPGSAAETSRMVFAFYRWRGWLAKDQPLAHQLQHALQLAASFAARPQSFATDELLQRAVPAWAGDEVQPDAAWIRSLQTEPRLWLRARAGQGSALCSRLGHASIVTLPDAVLYEGAQDLFRSPEFHSGLFEIQDVASQAVGFLCAPEPGQTWWDACAGEGGKLLHLSDLMQNKGLLWASDRAEWRLQKLKRRTARARCFNYRAAVWDGAARLPTKTRFDGVLLDAPCSGLGTWQRNPHARWTTTLDDIHELADLQQRLLSHAAPSVKPGGKLLYAVCTLARAETTEVASTFEKTHPDFAPLPLPNPFKPGSASVHPLLLWPQDTAGNGMFVAAWRRKS
jgi:16S rRNA (cytosine967-C5)-methyltransferase